MGEVRLVSFQGFLVGGMFWWMELDRLSLECNEMPSSEFWVVYGFGMALGSPSFNTQVCVLAFLQN